MQYMKRASDIKHSPPSFPDKILITLFYEPSTRTSCSFQSAAYKLGCKVINVTDKFSSVEKGETLEDTIKTLGCYGDVIVMRHPVKGSFDKACAVSKIPIINAGDGNGEHPTQALLDIYTIYDELLKHNMKVGQDFITVTFVGDLKNSRTVHSLVKILKEISYIQMIFVSPLGLELDEDIGIHNISLDEAICMTDVLYVTRVQKERFDSEDEYLSIINNYDDYRVTSDLLKYAKQEMIVMHPLPRGSELSVEVDEDPRAVYFKQVENGVYMRMAILESLFV
jgi:carbamoyl-phosphate synthase/aspartate carbamoyltransferase